MLNLCKYIIVHILVLYSRDRNVKNPRSHDINNYESYNNAFIPQLSWVLNDNNYQYLDASFFKGKFMIH